MKGRVRKGKERKKQKQPYLPVVLDCFEDRFRIVSEVRRLGDSEPCVEKCEDAAAVPSIIDVCCLDGWRVAILAFHLFRHIFLFV